jgi:hypothetical protein
VPRSGDAPGGGRPGDHRSRRVSQPDGRFETKWLCRAEILAALADLSGQWIDKVHERRRSKRIVLDMDSSESRLSSGLCGNMAIDTVGGGHAKGLFE